MHGIYFPRSLQAFGCKYMKYIKLDRKYKNYKKFGHQHGFKFNFSSTLGHSDNEKAREVKEILRNKYGCNYDTKTWDAYFGKRLRRHMSRPYFITFKGDDSLVTYLMLKVL